MMGEDQRMPRLFASSGTPVAEGKGVSHGVQTPMGDVRFTATGAGREIATGQPERWRVGDNAWLEGWESAGLELERLTCKIAPEPALGKRCDGCWGVIWRFLAHQRSLVSRPLRGWRLPARAGLETPASFSSPSSSRPTPGRCTSARRTKMRSPIARATGRTRLGGGATDWRRRRADVCQHRRGHGGSPPYVLDAAVV